MRSIGKGHLNSACYELLLDHSRGDSLEAAVLYVSDYHRISIFRPNDGTLVRVFGTTAAGSGPGQFNWPTGIALYTPPGCGPSDGLLLLLTVITTVFKF